MKIKKYIFAFALCMGSLTSCVDLDTSSQKACSLQKAL